MSSPGDERIVPEIPVAAARALEVFKALTSSPEGRRAFAERKWDAFDAFKRDLPEDIEHLRDADHEAITGPARALLERLSVSELALLSDLDAAYVASGLYADVPSPGFLMIH